MILTYLVMDRGSACVVLRQVHTNGSEAEVARQRVSSQILGGRIGAADSAKMIENLASYPTYSGGARVLETTLRR